MTSSALSSHSWPSDITVNSWRRDRVRRGESADLQNRLQNLQTHDSYLRSDEIEPGKLRFQLYLERYESTTPSTPPGDIDEIVTQLETARSQLASTPLGLELLIGKANLVEGEVKSAGKMSQASEATLRACAGLTNALARDCVGMNQVIKIESARAVRRAGQPGSTGQTKEVEPEKAKGDQSGGKGEGGKSSEEELRTLLASMIGKVARDLKTRKQLLEWIEKSQNKSRWAAAVLPDDRTFDRFARAETTYSRRIYRALEALAARKRAKNASKILP